MSQTLVMIGFSLFCFWFEREALGT